MFSLSSSLRFAVLAASFALATGCAASDADLEDEEGAAETLESQSQALINDDEEEPGGGGTTSGGTTPILETITLTMVSISADRRIEDHAPYGLTQEVFGSIAVNNITRGKGTARNLGKWGNPDLASAVGWTNANGGAPKVINNENPLSFATTRLCTSNTYANCQGPFATGNNVMVVPAKVGDKIRVDYNFQDFDFGSANDEFCHGSLSGTVKRNAQGSLYVENVSGRTARSETIVATNVTMYGVVPIYDSEFVECRIVIE
jgi:hypothetical protein